MVRIEKTIWGSFPHPFSEILSVGKKEVGQEKEKHRKRWKLRNEPFSTEWSWLCVKIKTH